MNQKFVSHLPLYRFILLLFVLVIVGVSVTLILYYYSYNTFIFLSPFTINIAFENDNVNNFTANTTCSPKELIGLLKVKLESPEFDVLKNTHHDLSIGGTYKPENCTQSYKVAIIIPYRDRLKHLKTFLFNIHTILKRQNLEYRIYIIEQLGNQSFNRAKLLNVGYKESLKLKKDWNCFVFHDVDYIPENDKNMYTCSNQPRQLSAAVNVFNYKLPYTDFFGGVTALTGEQFEKVNGYSNLYWGWGAEDDDLSFRLNSVGYKLERPSSEIGRYYMIPHEKEIPSPKRMKLLDKYYERISTDGLNSLAYEVDSIVLTKLFTWIKVKI